MLSLATSSILASSLLGVASAYPGIIARDDTKTAESNNATDAHFYRPPGPGDARAPCPGMNTLANHGYLPRNGREILDDDVVSAFMDGFNMDETVVHKALLNMFSVCRYVMGAECLREDGKRLMPNLTILAEPHTFEHDHSFSRQDYRMAWANGDTVDNFNYNATVFQRVLDVINGSSHVDYQLANQFRVDRYSQSLVDDLPGWFTAANPQAGTELGFIFSVMRDRTLADNYENPQVRTDWMHYWLANESFPYPLGWTKPEQVVNKDYVDSVSAEIYSATESLTTPTPVASNWIHNTDGSFLLPTSATVPILPLPTGMDAYYVASDAPALETVVPSKRGLGAYGVPKATHVAAAVSAAQEQPAMLNPYSDEIPHEHFAKLQAFAHAKVEAYKKKLQAA